MKKSLTALFFLPLLSFGQTPETGSDLVSSLTSIPVIISLVAIIFSVYLFFLVRKLNLTVSKLSADIAKLKIDTSYNKPSKQVTQLAEIENQNVASAKAELEAKFTLFEERIHLLENPPRTKEWSNAQFTKPKPEQVTAVLEGIDSIAVKRSVYAKFPNDDNTFSGEILLDAQNGEQIYELSLDGEEGTYTISQSPESQKYALTDINSYINIACESVNQPSKNSVITTRRVGKLSRSGDNWVIVEKAQIEFS